MVPLYSYHKFMEKDTYPNSLNNNIFPEKTAYQSSIPINSSAPSSPSPISPLVHPDETIDKQMTIVILLLVFIYPIGIILMWIFMKKWQRWLKTILSIPLALAIVAVILAFIILFFINPSKQLEIEKAKQYQKMNIPTVIPMVTITSHTPSREEIFSGTPVPTRPFVFGVAPTLIPVNASWLVYTNSVIGLTFSYPPIWQLVEQSNNSGVNLYPPNSDPQGLSPLISILFAPNLVYATGAPNSSYSDPTPYTVAGILGQQYHQLGDPIPFAGGIIEIPYRKGTLQFVATIGPNDNFLPQLEEILKTIKLQP